MAANIAMTHDDTEQLMARAKQGDRDARDLLLSKYRPRLRRMIQALIDPRMAARVDPSDVLQNTLVRAASRLSEYFDRPAIAFFAWLRQIARDELIQVHRQHVQAQRRSIHKEVRLDGMFSDVSALELAKSLVSKEPSPSRHVNLLELREKVRAALEQMSDFDRDILLMRCVEHLKLKEIAEILEVHETTAKSRLRRALRQLGQHVGREE